MKYLNKRYFQVREGCGLCGANNWVAMFLIQHYVRTVKFHCVKSYWLFREVNLKWIVGEQNVFLVFSSQKSLGLFAPARFLLNRSFDIE